VTASQVPAALEEARAGIASLRPMEINEVRYTHPSPRILAPGIAYQPVDDMNILLDNPGPSGLRAECLTTSPHPQLMAMAKPPMVLAKISGAVLVVLGEPEPWDWQHFLKLSRQVEYFRKRLMEFDPAQPFEEARLQKLHEMLE
jgi:hypothetical protein